MEEKVKFSVPTDDCNEFVFSATNDVDYAEVQFDNGEISKVSFRLKSK